MVLTNWKLSSSLAVLGLLVPWNQQEEKGITVLPIKGKLGCCYAIGLRNTGLWPFLRTPIPTINFSGKLATKVERAG